jgi:hypothetical protein
MESQQVLSPSLELNFNGRIIQAIESLEERISEISASGRQPYRTGKVLPTPAVAVVPSLTKPGNADRFKFCEEVKGIATTAMDLFRFDQDEKTAGSGR